MTHRVYFDRAISAHDPAEKPDADGLTVREVSIRQKSIYNFCTVFITSLFNN